MRGRTNITPVKNPYVKGDLVQAVVETGNTIETGDFVEVVYDGDTKLVNQGMLGNGTKNGSVEEFNGGFLWFYYLNNSPKLSYVKIENDNVVIKDTMVLTATTLAQGGFYDYFTILGSNLFAVAAQASTTTFNLYLYKVENNRFVKITELLAIPKTNQYDYAICKLSSTQIVVIGTMYSSSSSSKTSMLYRFINYTSTTLSLSGNEQTLSVSSFPVYSAAYSPVYRLINLAEGRILFCLASLKILKINPSDSTKLIEEKYTSGITTASNPCKTIGLPKLINSNKIMTITNNDGSANSPHYTKAWFCNLNNNTIDGSESFVIEGTDYGKGGTTASVWGKSVGVVDENNFLIAFWDATLTKIYIVRCTYNPGSDTITFSNKVSFTPNFYRNSSGSVVGAYACFGYFFYSGNDYYFVYTDDSISEQTSNLYVIKLNYSNGTLSIGEKTNKVRSYSGNGFVLGFAKTGGNAGDTITVYKPHSNS